MFSPRAKRVFSDRRNLVKYDVKQAITHKNKSLIECFYWITEIDPKGHYSKESDLQAVPVGTLCIFYWSPPKYAF